MQQEKRCRYDDSMMEWQISDQDIQAVEEILLPIRNFMVKTNEKGAKTVVAMLGEYGSLAYENGKFYKLDAEKVEVVNTVGAGDSYIAAFTYGVSLGEDIMQCMRRGRQRATEIIQQFNPYK